MVTDAGTCPLAQPSDPRKTAEIADARRSRASGAIQVGDAVTAKAVLRSRSVRQAGLGSEIPGFVKRLGNPPVVMLEGEAHRRQRNATARFFSPKIVTTRYLYLMEKTADDLVRRFRAKGRARLEDMSMALAVTIAAEIIGLTNSSRKGMTRRLGNVQGDGAVRKSDRLSVFLGGISAAMRLAPFFIRDVRPAIRARRRRKQEDVISHLVEEGYSDKEITIECLTYASAGMTTTREFIIVAFWHMMDDPDLGRRFVAADLKDQVLLLEEILRAEPVLGVIARRATEDFELPLDPPVKVAAGTLFEIDVRSANADEEAVGDCPYRIDPDRPVATKPGGAMFAFGDGIHRCPGSQVAMYETAIFLDRLLRVPGLRMGGTPKLGWAAMIQGYEVSAVTISCAVSPDLPGARKQDRP